MTSPHLKTLLRLAAALELTVDRRELEGLVVTTPDGWRLEYLRRAS